MYFTGKRIGFLASAHGVAQSELVGPWEALAEVGATVVLIGLEGGSVRAEDEDGPGGVFAVDQVASRTGAAELDGLVIPGGADNCARLAHSPDAVRLVREVASARLPIGAICHAVWLLIAADVVAGRQLTSWPTTEQDVVAAGGHWVDRRVVVDDHLVTSRGPEDLPAFLTQFAALLDR